MILPSVISREQGAFFEERSILDGLLSTSEFIDDRVKSISPRVICKLDLHKAYNHVNWELIYYILGRFRFGLKWRNWMWCCFSLASYSVLVNEVSTGYFDGSSGLRQGDPLSPLLFLLVAKTLRAMLCRAMESGLIKGFLVGKTNVTVSHATFKSKFAI